MSGEAIAASGLDRGEFFITSKLNNGATGRTTPARAFDGTLKALGTDYVDLFLIHWPLPTLYGGDFVQTWKTLEEFYRDGRAALDRRLQLHPAPPAPAARRDRDPAGGQPDRGPPVPDQRGDPRLRRDNEIANEAYSPIAQGEVLDDPAIAAIARAVGKTPAQVVLRWHIQRGDIIFPKSTTADRVSGELRDLRFRAGRAVDGVDHRPGPRGEGPYRREPGHDELAPDN